MTTIGLALWFAALGQDIWVVREAARERLLARCADHSDAERR